MSPDAKNRAGWLIGLCTLFGGIPLTAFATWIFFAGGIVGDVKTFKNETVPTVKELQIITAQNSKAIENNIKQLSDVTTKIDINEDVVQKNYNKSIETQVKLEDQIKLLDEVKQDIKEIKNMMIMLAGPVAKNIK